LNTLFCLWGPWFIFILQSGLISFGGGGHYRGVKERRGFKGVFGSKISSRQEAAFGGQNFGPRALLPGRARRAGSGLCAAALQVLRFQIGLGYGEVFLETRLYIRVIVAEFACYLL
jgi:hypothetical protein